MSEGVSPFGPKDALRLSIEETGTLTARDLPLPLHQAARLLRDMRRDGSLIEMLPGVFSRVQQGMMFGRRRMASSHLDAIAGYARAHGRIGLPSPHEAAHMVGLTATAPLDASYVWNGPARTLRIHTDNRSLAGASLRFDPMPRWALQRTWDPNIPFLLALSHEPSSYRGFGLEAFVRRMGPNASVIATTPRRGMPRDLALCLQRLKRACTRVLGDPTVDAEAVIRSIAPGLVPATPFDACRRASSRLVSALASRGVRADLVQHRGLLLESPEADPRWLAIDRSGWIHWAVEVPRAGLHIDLTYGQFDPSVTGPRIQPIVTARSQWRATF